MRTTIVFVLSIAAIVLGTPVCQAGMTLTPGIYSAEDFTAAPEAVNLNSTGTDDMDASTYRKSKTESFNLEVYDLKPGVYRFVNDPAAKTDPAAMKSDINTLSISSLIADSGAEGILIRGTGTYPGECVISFGLLNEYPDIPLDANGEFNYDKAAAEIGRKLYEGRRLFDVDGVVAAFENISIGDHANNNMGVVHTFGGGRTFMKDVWIYNVYDGIFFDDAAEGYFVNCIFHQTFQPWNLIDDALAAGYYTDDWNALVQPSSKGGSSYADGVGLSEDEYPEIKGVIIGNDAASGYNINLFETEEANPQYVYLKNCTLIKHQIRDSNRLWRHNTGGGEGVFVLIEDSMILSVDLSPNAQVRIDTDDADFFGSMFNTKVWNYASNNAQLTGVAAPFWNIDPNDALSLTDAKVDLATPGGLDVSNISDLFRLDGRLLTTFKADAIEKTMAIDGGPVGYRLPISAPAGPLPVRTSGQSPVGDWCLY